MFVDFQEAAYLVCVEPLTLIYAFALAVGITLSIYRLLISPLRADKKQQPKR